MRPMSCFLSCCEKTWSCKCTSGQCSINYSPEHLTLTKSTMIRAADRFRPVMATVDIIKIVSSAAALQPSTMPCRKPIASDPNRVMVENPLTCKAYSRHVNLTFHSNLGQRLADMRGGASQGNCVNTTPLKATGPDVASTSGRASSPATCSTLRGSAVFLAALW